MDERLLAGKAFFWLNTPLNLSVSLSLTKRMLRMLSSLKIWSMSPCTVLKGKFPTYAVNGGSDGSSFCFLGPPEVPAPGRGLGRRKSSKRYSNNKYVFFYYASVIYIIENMFLSLQLKLRRQTGQPSGTEVAGLASGSWRRVQGDIGAEMGQYGYDGRSFSDMSLSRCGISYLNNNVNNILLSPPFFHLFLCFQ